MSLFPTGVIKQLQNSVFYVWPWKWKSSSWIIWLTFDGIKLLVNLQMHSKNDGSTLICFGKMGKKFKEWNSNSLTEKIKVKDRWLGWSSKAYHPLMISKCMQNMMLPSQVANDVITKTVDFKIFALQKMKTN